MIRFTEEEGEKLLKAASRNKFLPSANSARSRTIANPPSEAASKAWKGLLNQELVTSTLPGEDGRSTVLRTAIVKPKQNQSPGKSKETSAIEEQFAAQIHCAGLPEPKRQLQYMFAREFKADFAWPQWKFAVEVQGNAHRIKGRFKSDMKRRALLLLDGWTILEVGGDEIRSGIAVKWTEAMIKQMQAKHAG